jgi:hypothetical protein
MKKIILITLTSLISSCLGGNDDREECHEVTVLEQYDFSNVSYSGNFYNNDDFIANVEPKLISVIYTIRENKIEVVYNIEQTSTSLMKYEIGQEYAGVNSCIYSYNHILEEYIVPKLTLTMSKYIFNDIEIPLNKSLSEDEKPQMYYFDDREKIIEKYHIIRSTEPNSEKIIGIRFDSYDIYLEGYIKKDMPGRFDCSVCR